MPIELFDQLRILLDFGLFILIWLVQLIIYPSFRYCEFAHLRSWHNAYTGWITVFVVPLMFGQVGVVLWQLGFDFSLWHAMSAALVLGCWVVTFCWSVPQHSKIAAATDRSRSDPAIHQLVLSNWPRTLGWTLVLGLGIADNGILRFFL